MSDEGKQDSETEHSSLLAEIIDSIRLDASETANPVLHCFECNRLSRIDSHERAILDFLMGCGARCHSCQNPLDVWKHTVLTLATPGGLFMSSHIGVRHTSIMYPLAEGQVVEFDLQTKGVPSDALLLRIKHKASRGDGLTLADLNAVDSARDLIPQVKVVGVRLAPSAAQTMQASTLVTWAKHDADDEGRQNLYRALTAFTDGRKDDALVFANIAVELTLASIIKEHLLAIGISKKQQKDNKTAYSYQLNILLPALGHAAGLPAMQTELLSLLNKLRGARNDVGHQGKVANELSPTDYALYLSAAIFGFYYLQIAREFLQIMRTSIEELSKGENTSSE